MRIRKRTAAKMRIFSSAVKPLVRLQLLFAEGSQDEERMMDERMPITMRNKIMMIDES